MDELLNKAFKALKTLPIKDQSCLAREIIERGEDVEDKAKWDRIVSKPESQYWLANEAATALKKHKKATKPLSMSFISLSDENLLREDDYWRHFEDLSEKVKNLAERNYRLWKKNPQHHSLRFMKIHTELPIFSFRVGMKHRAVGVETNDGKIVWFWMGAFEQFIRLTNTVSASE